MKASRGRIALGLATIYLVWGSTYLAIRYAIETIPPFTMSGLRYVVAGALLYAFARLKGAPPPEGRHWAAALVLGALLLLCGNGGVVWAEQRIASGLAALLVATEPLWIVLLQWISPGGPKPGARAFSGVALGLLGVAVLVGPGTLGSGRSIDPLGALAVVFAALAWATGSLRSRSALRPSSAFLGTAIQMLAGGGLLLLAGAATGELSHLSFSAVSSRSLLALLYLIVLGSLVAFTTYIWLLRAASPSRVSTYAFVNPIVAVLLGWLIGGEPVSPRMLIAAAIIVVAVVLITLPGSASSRSFRRGVIEERLEKKEEVPS